jgi:hypothetical protein
MFVAMDPAMLPPEKADPAKLDAWLNLSHLENASVFIIVKTSAMTCDTNSCQQTPTHKNPTTWGKGGVGSRGCKGKEESK